MHPTLSPGDPAGRANPVALAFAAEIARMRIAGHSCKAIYVTWLDAGVQIFRRVSGRDASRTELPINDTDCTALITRAPGSAARLFLPQELATQRLARGVGPELDACFAAPGLVYSM